MEENVDPIEAQYDRIQASKTKPYEKKVSKYDKKNYLNVKLDSKETEKKVIVRIISLTLDSVSPFKEIYTHWFQGAQRSFVCPRHTDGLEEGAVKTCPFCDAEEEAKLAQRGANDVLYKKLKDMAFANHAQANYAVRVIERSDEEFGPKFWKFNQLNYETIIDIWKNNKVDGIDIFDQVTGKDLIITIKKKDNKSKITNISAANRQTPISADTKVLKEWLEDEKKWDDVFTIKSYEYMKIVIDGGEPWFDKPTNKWIDKKELAKEEEVETDDENTYSENEPSDVNSGSDEHDLPF